MHNIIIIIIHVRSVAATSSSDEQSFFSLRIHNNIQQYDIAAVTFQLYYGIIVVWFVGARIRPPNKNHNIISYTHIIARYNILYRVYAVRLNAIL